MRATVPATALHRPTGSTRSTGRQPSVADRVAVVALGTAVAYGALAQGAFYTHQSDVVVLAVAVAAGAWLLGRLLRGGRGSWRVAPPVLFCAVAWTLFAAWVLGRAAVDGDAVRGLPAAGLALTLAVAAVVAASLPTASRRVLHAVVLVAGTVVAASGWAGVALHLSPLALPSYTMWRASATLTYANSAAAFLVVALLVAVAVLPPARSGSRAVVAVLLLGLLATMSRAGLLALAVAVAVYTVALPAGRRRDLLSWWPVLPAAAAGFAGLLPGLPEQAAPAPGAAVAGLAAGLAVLLATRTTGIRAATVAVAGLAVAAAVLVPGSAAAGSIADARFTAASPERADLSRVTLAQFEAAPIDGVGPGRLDLTYVDHRGLAVRAFYTHDEYLQTAAETGVVGLALVLTGAAALAATVLRGRRRAPVQAAAALAVLAAVAVHSGFDFLWHIAVLPLLLVLSVVTLLPSEEIR